jgi:type II secretory pathway component PulC
MTGSTWQRGRTLGLAALCLLGAILVALELGKWPFLGSAPEPARKASPPASSKKAPINVKKAGNPFARASQASALPVTSAETGITVYGVIIGPEGSIVLAKAGGDGIKQYKSGQSLGGFQIKEVKPDRLVLQKGDNGPTRTIRWLKQDDYLSRPRPSPTLPPSQGQIEKYNGNRERKEGRPRGFHIKPGPKEKFRGTER